MATEKSSAMKKHHSGPQTIPFLVDPNGWWNLHLQWLDWHFSRTLIQTTRCSLPNNHDPGLFLLDRLFIDVPSSICPDVQGFQSMGSLLPLFSATQCHHCGLVSSPPKKSTKNSPSTSHATARGWFIGFPRYQWHHKEVQIFNFSKWPPILLVSSCVLPHHNYITVITIIGLQPGCLISCCFFPMIS